MEMGRDTSLHLQEQLARWPDDKASRPATVPKAAVASERLTAVNLDPQRRLRPPAYSKR